MNIQHKIQRYNKMSVCRIESQVVNKSVRQRVWNIYIEGNRKQITNRNARKASSAALGGHRSNIQWGWLRIVENRSESKIQNGKWKWKDRGEWIRMNEWVRHVAVSAYKLPLLGKFYFDKWLYSITAISQVCIGREGEGEGSLSKDPHQWSCQNNQGEVINSRVN